MGFHPRAKKSARFGNGGAPPRIVVFRQGPLSRRLRLANRPEEKALSLLFVPVRWLTVAGLHLQTTTL